MMEANTMMPYSKWVSKFGEAEAKREPAAQSEE